MNKGQLVQPICNALALFLPREVQTPKRVVKRFRTHCHLCGERFLAKVHKSSAHLEVLAEVVGKVHTEHGLALHAIVRVAFKTYVDVGAGIENALIKNMDNA